MFKDSRLKRTFCQKSKKQQVSSIEVYYLVVIYTACYLQDELFLEAFRAVDSLNFGVWATVLNSSSLEGDFPFEHGYYKVSI